MLISKEDAEYDIAPEIMVLKGVISEVNWGSLDNFKINGITVTKGDDKINTDELTSLFTNKNLNAKDLRTKFQPKNDIKNKS